MNWGARKVGSGPADANSRSDQLLSIHGMELPLDTTFSACGPDEPEDSADAAEGPDVSHYPS